MDNGEIETLRQQLIGLQGRFEKDQDRIKCQAEQLATLRNRVFELEKMVVMRFDHDVTPKFEQGFRNHEVLEPVTAEHCTFFVNEIVSLRQQLAEKEGKYSAVCEKWHQAVDTYMEGNEVIQRLEQQLAASQAREQQLRYALDHYQHGGSSYAKIAKEALSLPTDTSALEALIAKAGEVMRERCQLELRRLDYWFTDEPIRALPGVTMEDLK